LILKLKQRSFIFATSEGYVKADGTYVFQYKDHLGNVRLSYTNNNGVAQIIDENNFYPFGLRQSDNSSISTLNKNQKEDGKDDRRHRVDSPNKDNIQL